MDMSEDRKECHKCLSFNRCSENVSYGSNYCLAHRKQKCDKSVANMENYECLKSELLQRPISFLTEENLDKLETHCRKAVNFEKGVEHKVVLELLERYYRYQKEIYDKNNKITKLQKENEDFKNKAKENEDDKL